MSAGSDTGLAIQIYKMLAVTEPDKLFHYYSDVLPLEYMPAENHTGQVRMPCSSFFPSINSPIHYFAAVELEFVLLDHADKPVTKFR